MMERKETEAERFMDVHGHRFNHPDVHAALVIMLTGTTDQQMTDEGRAFLFGDGSCILEHEPDRFKVRKPSALDRPESSNATARKPKAGR